MPAKTAVSAMGRIYFSVGPQLQWTYYLKYKYAVVTDNLKNVKSLTISSVFDNSTPGKNFPTKGLSHGLFNHSKTGFRLRCLHRMIPKLSSTTEN